VGVYASVGGDLQMMEGAFLDVAADVVGTGGGIRITAGEDDTHEGSVLLTPNQARAVAKALEEAAREAERAMGNASYPDAADSQTSPGRVRFEDLPRCGICGGILSPWPPFLGPEGANEIIVTVCGCDLQPNASGS
jgi:hypothetical protein